MTKKSVMQEHGATVVQWIRIPTILPEVAGSKQLLRTLQTPSPT